MRINKSPVGGKVVSLERGGQRRRTNLQTGWAGGVLTEVESKKAQGLRGVDRRTSRRRYKEKEENQSWVSILPFLSPSSKDKNGMK
jgi:hypothetical protein